MGFRKNPRMEITNVPQGERTTFYNALGTLDTMKLAHLVAKAL